MSFRIFSNIATVSFMDVALPNSATVSYDYMEAYIDIIILQPFYFLGQKIFNWENCDNKEQDE